MFSLFIHPSSVSEVFEVVLPFFGQLVSIRFPPRLFVGVIIEALGISRISHRRYYWASGFPIIDFLPVYSTKERMILDVLSSTSDVTQPFRSIDRTKLTDDIFGFVGNMGFVWEVDWPGHNSAAPCEFSR